MSILVVILIILLVLALLQAPRWGYFPGGILGVIVLILVVLILTGHLNV